MKNGKNKNPFGDFDSLFNDLGSMFGFTPNSFNGDSNIEEGEDEKGKWVKQTFLSEDGSVAMTSFYRTSGDSTPGKKNKLDLLKTNLNRAIEAEEFERAITLRDEIKKLEDNQETINNLEKTLDQHVKDQNFEEAIKVRDMLNELKGL